MGRTILGHCDAVLTSRRPRVKRTLPASRLIKQIDNRKKATRGPEFASRHDLCIAKAETPAAQPQSFRGDIVRNTET